MGVRTCRAGVEVWRRLFIQHPQHSGKYDAKLTKAAANWKDGDDVLEALFGLTRKSVENEPLKIYLALSDVDRHRTTPLDAETADRLAREFNQFGAQYSLFAEAPEIRNATIGAFLDTAEEINQIKDMGLRSDAAGTFQALTAIWQILYRQQVDSRGGIGCGAGQDRGAVRQSQERAGSLRRRAGRGEDSAGGHAFAGGKFPQDRMIDLLAGAPEPADAEAHTQMVEDMIRIFESQRLISLNTIFDLVDNLESLSRGEKVNQQLIDKAAARIAEIQLPRASMSSAEKNALAFGYWPEKHIEQQRKLNLRALIDRSANDPKKLDDIRGLLAPFLRDTLVGLTYVHYAPPGAQILHTNPLFVRSHDFVGLQGIEPDLEEHRSARQRLAVQRRRQAGGLAERAALCARRSRAEFPDPVAGAGFDLGRSGSADDPDRDGAALVERDARATALGGAAHELRRGQDVGSGAERGPPAGVSGSAGPARAAGCECAKSATLLENGQVQAATDNIMPSEMFAVAVDMLAANKGDRQARSG